MAAGDASMRAAVGILDNSLAGYTTFGDANGLLGDEVLIRYTVYGDADLNGVVNFDNDYILWQMGFLNGLTGWAQGDFNYDGVVDFDNDYILWQTALLAQPAGAVPAGAMPEPGVWLVLWGGAFLRLRRLRARDGGASHATTSSAKRFQPA